MVTGGASSPRSSTVTDRSHAAILEKKRAWDSEKEMQETSLTEHSDR